MVTDPYWCDAGLSTKCASLPVPCKDAVTVPPGVALTESDASGPRSRSARSGR